jgi:hypothetical protein
VIVYTLLLAGGAAVLASLRRDPQRDLDHLTARVRDDATGARFFRADSAAVGLLPGHGWTATLWVGDQRGLAPADFLVLTRMDGALTGELLLDGPGGGHMGSIVLRGPELAAYLDRGGLAVGGLDAACLARLGPR